VGAGVKGKVIGAMMVGLPSVATSTAAEGMGLTSGSDVLVADEPREIANAIVRLCRDEELWYRISDQGLITSQAEFSVEAQIPRWREMLRALALPN
jgi:glycosyltransferase involved in cell wall biosynthesis